MTTETIDIRIREDGSRVVTRDIAAIGTGAVKASNGVNILKGALAALGLGALAREVLQLVNTYGNLQNRLRAVGLEGVGLSATYDALLRASNDTRSSLEGTVELYSRLATSTTNLGVSQQQLVQFTTSLNQALVLSGASAAEAQGGLAQISQALGSDTLQGEELKSILENLPAVADVIAKSMGVARGELKQLGAAGKISGQTILTAFKDARLELAEKFAKTVPTVSQAFQVLKNNLLTFVGELDKSIGFSESFSKSISFLASNLGNISTAIARLAETLVVVGVAYIGFIAATKAQSLVQAAKSALDFASAVSSGRLVLLGSAEAARQQSIALVSSAQAENNAALSALSLARANSAKVLATQQSIRATQGDIVAISESSTANAAAAVNRIRWTQAQLVAERELELVRMRAQISDTGRMLSATRLGEIRRTEVALTKTLATAEVSRNAAVEAQTAAYLAQGSAIKQATSQTVAARQAVTAAEQSVAKSSAALGVATAASTAATAKAAGSTSLLSQALGFLGGVARTVLGAIGSMFAVIAANPIAALLIVVTGAVASLIGFRNQILLGSNSITTINDLLRALGETIENAFRPLVNVVKSTFSEVSVLIKGFFGDIDISVLGVIRGVAAVVDIYVNLWRGAVSATVAIFEGLPKALSDLFVQALNFILGKISDFVNATATLINRVTEFAGLGRIADNIDFTLPNGSEGAASKLGSDIAGAFAEGFNRENVAAKFVNDLTARANEFAAARAESERLAARNPNLPSSVAGVAAKSPVDEKAINQATNALRSLLNTILPSSGAILELAKAQNVLTEAQNRGLITGAQHAQYLEIAKRHYEDIINPLGAINREITEQTKLLSFSNKEREVESQLLSKQKDLLSVGITLSLDETKALRERLVVLRDLNIIVAAQDQLLQDSVGKRQEFAIQLLAIQNLLNDPTSGFTKGDANTALQGANGDILGGTQSGLDAQVAAYENMYARINALRSADLISETTASQAKQQTDIAYATFRLKSTTDIFANLASLSSSGNERLARIGRAAAITTATIDGVVAVQKALAAPPGWPYNAATVVSVGVSAAANVAKLAGFESGGYTGNNPTDKISGVVHGQEFVMNAEATSRNRSALEAMNNGQQLGGSKVSVVVNNNASGTKATTTERETPDGKQIEITIEEVIVKSVKRGGRVAEAFESQYNLNRAVGVVR